MLHTPPRHKFSSISLYGELFLSYSPIFGKVHWMTPHDPDMFKAIGSKLRKNLKFFFPKFKNHLGVLTTATHTWRQNQIGTIQCSLKGRTDGRMMEQAHTVPWSHLVAY